MNDKKHLEVHRVGYINLSVVTEKFGKEKCKLLREQLQYAETSGSSRQCSLEQLQSVVDEFISDENPSQEDQKFLNQFLIDCVDAGATGDLIWHD